MEANLDTFRHLRKELRATLYGSYGEPLSCELHELLPIDAETDASYGIPIDNQHSALACNIASVIVSIERLLSSPKSNIGCQELFEILVLRLDVLREYIFESLNLRIKSETLAEKKIRAWAGFLKHPDRFVHAHTCNLDNARFGFALTINTDTLISWQDEFTEMEKDKKLGIGFKKFYSSKKAEYASKLTKIEHLSIEDICEFFSDCQERINKLIDNSFPQLD